MLHFTPLAATDDDVYATLRFIIPKPEMVDYRLIPDQYLVKFTPGAAGGHPHALANQLARAHSARILFVYDALGGTAFEMNEHQARAMARNPEDAMDDDVQCKGGV